MDYRALRTILLQPGYTDLSDEDAAIALNARTVEQISRVAIGDIQRVMMASGSWWLVKGAAASDTVPVDVKTAAGIVLEMLTACFNEIYMNDAKTQQVFGLLVTALLMDSPELEEITAMGVQRISPAQAAGFGLVRIGDVVKARANA